MTKEGEQLAAIVLTVINTRKDQVRISPAWIATEAMRKLQAMRLRQTKPLVYEGCHLQLRQIARKLCIKMFETADPEEASQHEMYPDLQRRYPVARDRNSGEEPLYVKLEDMSDEDVQANIVRMRSQGRALMSSSFT
jgi:hypothetical protein